MSGDLGRYAAANARVRVLLSDLLGRKGLETLATYPPAAFKDALARTAYGTTVGSATTAEAIMALRLPAVAGQVLRLLAGPERAFLHLYLLHHEVENIKLIVRAVHRGIAWESIAPAVIPLPGIETIDPSTLASARDLDGIADRLAATPYGAALRHALHRVEAAGAFAAEVAVELDYYERLWDAAAWLRPADTSRARQLLGMLFDILNLGWIARYRDVLHLSPEEILSYTLRQGRFITPALRQQLAAGSRQPWDAILAGTPYAAFLADVAARGFDARWSEIWRLLSGEVERALSGYPFHIGVPLGFLLAQEIEIRDLHIMLAAKRLALSVPEVAAHLGTTRT